MHTSKQLELQKTLAIITGLETFCNADDSTVSFWSNGEVYTVDAYRHAYADRLLASQRKQVLVPQGYYPDGETRPWLHAELLAINGSMSTIKYLTTGVTETVATTSYITAPE